MMARYFFKLRKLRGVQYHGSMWSFNVNTEDKMRFPQLFDVETVWLIKGVNGPYILNDSVEEVA
jgi:hypothetical protein